MIMQKPVADVCQNKLCACQSLQMSSLPQCNSARGLLSHKQGHNSTARLLNL